MTYNEISIEFLINYHSIRTPLQKIEVYPEPDNPIVGDGDSEGYNINYSSEITKTYGPNIYYDAIPFEMLMTMHDKPQVKVTVDGMPAVCASTKCDYEFMESPSTVTGVEVSNLDVIITGISLPYGEEIESVRMSKTDCTVNSSSSTQITCNLQSDWVQGEWIPEIRTVNGLAAVADSVTPFTMGGSITSVSPSLDLNKAGG
jgi:hypothetical protein